MRGGGTQDNSSAFVRASQSGNDAVLTQIIHAPTMRESLLPVNTNRIHTVELPPLVEFNENSMLDQSNEGKAMVQYTNDMNLPNGSKGSQVPCIDLVVKIASKVMWKDQLPGTSCTALCATKKRLAVGTADGAIQLYGTSPSKGWDSGFSFRSYAPMITGFPIVSLKLRERDDNEDMLVVSADGSFAVYSLVPQPSLRYKGSIFPAMRHMSIQSTAKELVMPKLSRIQLTDFDSVFIILSHADHASNEAPKTSSTPNRQGGVGVGGSLQAFLYDKSAELWLRMSDSRFALSDFFTTVPSSIPNGSFLTKADNSVCFGSIQSTLKSNKTRLGDGNASAMYGQLEDESGNFIATRSHCEDRMACSLALKSSADFKEWLVRYARTIARRGMESQLRHLIDSLLGRITQHAEVNDGDLWWWLSRSPDILGLDRRELVKNSLLPEIGKNRALQRIVAEISMQLQAL